MQLGYLASVRLAGKKATLFTVLLSSAPPIGSILVDMEHYYRVTVIEVFIKPIHPHQLVAQHNAGVSADLPASITGVLYVEEVHPTHRNLKSPRA